MKKIVAILFFAIFCKYSYAQEAFTITHYHINLKVNKNASIDITEDLRVHFTESRHGIIRSIQYQYPMEKIPAGIEKAERQMYSNGYTRIFIENVKVPRHHFSTSKNGDYENIKIGSADKYVEGDQQYVLKYTILNAVNFFENHSEQGLGACRPRRGSRSYHACGGSGTSKSTPPAPRSGVEAYPLRSITTATRCCCI